MVVHFSVGSRLQRQITSERIIRIKWPYSRWPFDLCLSRLLRLMEHSWHSRNENREPRVAFTSWRHVENSVARRLRIMSTNEHVFFNVIWLWKNALEKVRSTLDANLNHYDIELLDILFFSVAKWMQRTHSLLSFYFRSHFCVSNDNIWRHGVDDLLYYS